MGQGGQGKQSGYRWLVFGLLAMGYILVYFHRLSINILNEEMSRDLAAGAVAMGHLGAGYFYSYTIMQLPSGLLADSLGPRRTVTISFLLAGSASIFLGMVNSVEWAIFARILVGLGVSILYVATLKILTRWFKASQFAWVIGILMALGGVGVLTTATPLAILSGLAGWRGSFIIIGAATLVLAVFIWIFVRNSPEEKGLPAPEAAPATEERPESLLKGLGQVLKAGRTWPVAIWFFFGCGVFFTYAGVWGARYLMDVYGMTKSEAGHVMDMLAYAMIVGSPLLSMLSERIKSRKKVLVGCSVVLLAVTYFLAFQTASLPRWALYAITFAMSLTASAVVVVAFTCGKELFPISMAGTSLGVVNLFPFAAGAATPPILGYILKSSVAPGAAFSAQAYSNGFKLFFCYALVALAASLFMTESYGGWTPGKYNRK